MPGFSLIFTPKSEAMALGPRCEAALRTMIHDERYECSSVHHDAFSSLNWTGYPGYPVQTWETDEFVLLFEGCAFDGDLNKLKESLTDQSHGSIGVTRASDRIQQWMHGADGDFVIVYISKQRARGIVVAVDPIGRLPVYWRLDYGRLLVSREIKFVARLSESLKPDSMGVTETLLFASPLADRTLLEGISHLPPGGVLSWEAESENEPRLRSQELDFTTQHAGIHRMEDLAERLASEFTVSCLRRAQAFAGRPLVLSLSGGLDSRGVAAAFQKLGHPTHARTFTDGSHQRNQDSAIAPRLASIAGLNWKLVRVSRPSLDAAERLIALKDGMNSAAMAHAEEYLGDIRIDFGSEAILLGGAGGDLTLPPILPYRKLKSIRDLALILMSRRTKFDPASVAQLTGTTTQDLDEHLTSHLSRFPEEDLNDRYLHFFFSEFELRGTFEGLDRNRCHLWTVSPYYGRPFFTTATTAPSAWKRCRRLQVAFLRRLSRDLARVPSANTGLVPGSMLDEARQRFREFTLSTRVLEPIWFAQRTIRSGRGFVAPTPVKQRLLELARESKVIDSVFNRERLLETVGRPMSGERFWMLFTIVRYLSALD